MRRSGPIALDRAEFQRHGLGQRGQRAARRLRHAQALAEQLGRQVDQQFVDQAFAHQRAIELEAGLDVQLVDLARAPGRAAGRPGRPCRRAPGRSDDGGAARLAAPPRRRASCDGGVDPDAARPGMNRRASGGVSAGCRPPPACGWRGVSTRRTSSRGSSSQHGADAGQDGAGAGAPGMAVGARGFAGDPLAARRCPGRSCRRARRRPSGAPRACRAPCG